MGLLLHLRTREVLDAGDDLPEAPEAPADPWETVIGTALRPFCKTHPRSTSEHIDAPDGQILLKHLLLTRGPRHWDDSACKRITNEMFRRFVSEVEVNREFVLRKIASLAGPNNTRMPIADRLLTDPLRAFERALRDSRAQRVQVLRRSEEAYVMALCAVFVAALFEANQHLPPAPSEEPRVPAPSVRSDRTDPGRFRR